MKKTFITMVAFALLALMACERKNLAEGELSPIISVEDLRLLYKGQDVILNSTTLSGAAQIQGVVISDAKSGNSHDGTLVLQNTRRQRVRGISIIVGEAAINYSPGDSVIININGSTLGKGKNTLQISGLKPDAVQLISKDNQVSTQSVTIKQLKDNPDIYESTLVKIYSGDFVPEPVAGDTYNGNKVFTDGTGEILLHTEVTANFAGLHPPATASFTGIPLFYSLDENTAAEITLWPRNADDIKAKSLIIAWNLMGAVGNEVTSTSNIVNTNLDASVLSRGPGITLAAAGASYASTFPINGDKASAIAAGSYYQFMINPKGNAKISLSALDIILRIQANAPKTYIWMYSIDGGISFSDIGEHYTVTTGFSDNNGLQQPQVDLSQVEDFKNITSEAPVIFRLYAWGGISISSNNGFRIGKSLTVAQHALSLEGTILEENTL